MRRSFSSALSSRQGISSPSTTTGHDTSATTDAFSCRSICDGFGDKEEEVEDDESEEDSDVKRSSGIGTATESAGSATGGKVLSGVSSDRDSSRFATVSVPADRSSQLACFKDSSVTRPTKRTSESLSSRSTSSNSKISSSEDEIVLVCFSFAFSVELESIFKHLLMMEVSLRFIAT